MILNLNYLFLFSKICIHVLSKYLGFGAPTSGSSGRRAAQSSASPMEDDQEERDRCLTKVQARDLVEFGMIPVFIELFLFYIYFLLYKFL